MEERISIKIHLEKEIILTREDWENLKEKLPRDFEELEELEDVMIMSNLEIIGSEFNERFIKE